MHRHQSGPKFWFNLATFAFSTSAAVVVYECLHRSGGFEPLDWCAIVVACATADIVSAAAVEQAISIMTARPPEWRKLAGPGLLYTLTNAIIGIAIVLLISVRPEAALLAIVVVLAMLWAYGASDRERRKRDELALIHEVTQARPHSRDPLPIVSLILKTAKELSGARVATIRLAAGTGPDAPATFRLDGDDEVRRVADDEPWSLGRATRSYGPMRGRWIHRLQERWRGPDLESLTVSVPGDEGVTGSLAVSSREVAARRWSTEDVTALATLANHAGIALGNARLLGEMTERAVENEHLARHDTLTGLPNRLRLEELLREATRDHDLAALLVMDLDAFKEVNDTLGHATGDRLLVGSGGSASREVRRGREIVARLSGDEFGLLAFGDSGRRYRPRGPRASRAGSTVRDRLAPVCPWREHRRRACHPEVTPNPPPPALTSRCTSPSSTGA